MVKIYKQELTPLQEEILKVLCIRAGERLNQNMLAKRLDVSQAGISKALDLLNKLEYIIQEKDKEGGRWSIQLNRDNKDVIRLKRVINLELLYKSKIVEYLEEYFPGRTIILFGSYSRGEDVYNSDIDIAIISSKKNIDLVKFENMLDKKIVLNFYKSLNIDKELKENLFNGVVISGGIEL